MNITLRTVALIVLLAGAGSAVAGAPIVRLYTDFSQPGGWPQESDRVKFTVANGVLRGTSAAGAQPTTYQPVAIGAAGRWRAQADVTFRAYDEQADYKRAGLVVFGPLDSRLYVGLTSSGYAYAQFYDGKTWAETDPLPMTDATAARAGLNATNQLAVEREAGYFTVYVNGTYVGRTRIIDFSPRQVGVFQTSSAPLTVEYDNLSLSEIGLDTRYSRLFNNVGTAGAPELLIDNFDQKRKKGEGWPQEADSTGSSFIRNGRYELTGSSDDTSYWVSGNPYLLALTEIGGGIEIGRPRHPAAYQLSARFAQINGDPDWAKGLAILGRRPEGAAHRPVVSLQFGGGSFRVIHQPAEGDQVDLMGWTETPSLNRGAENWLNLTVMPDGRLLVFINWDYQATLQMPKGFVMDSLGLMATGKQAFAVDDFYAREL